ncbi:tyrosine-protein kinase family protein, partial [Planctomycetota bacterium]
MVSEECSRILQKIRSSSTGQRLGSIGLLSCDETSTTSGFASQLAIVAGTKYGLSTLLIDGDKKLRTVSKMFRLNGAPGLGELATSEADVDICVQSSKYENLMLMTPQAQAKTLPQLVHPHDVESLLHQLTDEYDLVIIDLPPDESADGNLSRLVDNVFVVADSEKSSTVDATEAINRLRNADAHVTGLVLQGAGQHNGR